MNEKISLQDLVDALAQKHSMAKKDADAFVKAMFDLVEEGLERDKYVKVKGLGSFKLIGVEERESVNVNTGERFRIEGHSKVSFTPDAALRDLINRPFAHFETVVVNDGVDLNTPLEEDGGNDSEDVLVAAAEGPLVEEAVKDEPKVENLFVENASVENPIVEDSMVELPIEANPTTESMVGNDSKVEDSIVETPVAERQTIEEPIAEEPRPIVELPRVEEPIISSDSEKLEVVEEPAAIVGHPTVEEPKDEDVLSVVGSPKESVLTEIKGSAQKALEEEERKSHTAAYVIGGLAVVLIGLIIWFVFGMQLKEKEMKQAKRSAPVPSAVKPKTEPVSADTVALPAETRPAVAEEPMKTPEQAPSMSNGSMAANEASSEPAPAMDPDKTYKAVGLLIVHELKPGESLAKLARKYYGTNKLQNYIYDYNKADLKNPDVIPVGAKIKVPKLVPVE